MASRVENINDFGERGISQSDREFFDKVDRNTAHNAQRLGNNNKEVVEKRENFERTVNWKDSENRKLFQQKESEVNIPMIEKKISDMLLDK